ncbi:VOC family protein [Pseudactinotalea sp.]|uniref:VOC family protein n=1 Tax=Pseudactinotalea sp. TaxID=1926260 RepID=UPI003B3B07FD
MSIPAAPEGYATINPFIITHGAEELTRFLVEVFEAAERPDARTVDDDGLLLQAEVVVGGTTLMLAERKPDWPFTPSLLQVYVDDVEATLRRALDRGSRLITRPTDFFGTSFARFQDPSANIWWVWQHGEMAWDQQADAESWTSDDAPSEDWAAVSPDLAYIHDTLLEAMQTLRDPRS